jgi:ABC-type multidrug transport system ATPase subunit
MGPSGSGKTTLMRVLADRAKSGTVSGLCYATDKRGWVLAFPVC